MRRLFLCTFCCYCCLPALLSCLAHSPTSHPDRHSKRDALTQAEPRLLKRNASVALLNADRRHFRSLPAPNVSLLPGALHASKCAADCTQHGTCNEELGRCDCPHHKHGSSCSLDTADLAQLCRRYGFTAAGCMSPDKGLCLNACNYRGKCIGGFCHCRAGFYGADCSLSLDSAGKPELLMGQGYVPRAKGPRIYVYELPPNLTTWHSNMRLDRPLHMLMWQRLLSAGVRVADGDTADFYYVPVKARMPYDSPAVQEALLYIQATWPWFKKLAGDRHILVQTGDKGRDDTSDEVTFLTRNSIWLSHWGLARNHAAARLNAAHRPGKDIVVPAFIPHALVEAYRLHRSPLNPFVPLRRPRERTLFFAGRICGDQREPSTSRWPNCADVLGKPDVFSAGTRQAVHWHHHNRTGFKVVTSSKTQFRDVVTSRFCLAPTASGFDKRSVMVTLMGCIPVTVTDGVLQPFEPELAWSDFAIDVLEQDIPRLHRILGELSESQVEEFQSHLHCAVQHLSWSSIYGSLVGEDGRYDAFETVMEILRMRLKHPQLHPEEYINDPDFAAFAECRSVLLQDPPDLCSQALSLGRAYPCDRCEFRKGKFLNPGGAICCSERELAKCPRMWE